MQLCDAAQIFGDLKRFVRTYGREAVAEKHRGGAAVVITLFLQPMCLSVFCTLSIYKGESQLFSFSRVRIDMTTL